MSFGADLNKFTETYKKRLRATARTASQDMGNEVISTRGEGGRLPIDTGFLRASFGYQIGQPPRGPGTPVSGKEYNESVTGLPQAVALAKWDFEQPLFMGFTAVYARRLEFGFNGQDKAGRFVSQPPLAFVRGAAEKWPQFVESAARRARARIK